LNARDIQGVRFVPVEFKPLTNPIADRACHGVQIVLIDRQALDPAELGVEIAAALRNLYPDVFKLEKTLPLIGARGVMQDIGAGKDPRLIVDEWQGALEQIRSLRSKYLLYP
jgi:uncharacterized protein YbbC (DUF1343 family)